MSINVTVSGNPINIRRGRVVLSDLDQIKKNERDRRRRLRLEQVRQQSKEISNRLLERAKNIAQQELGKLEKDDKSELKRLHERKIMEIQEKYQEDMENIGQAHLAAVLESEALADIEDETDRNRETALKRGKEALELLKRVAKDDRHAMHRQRLQQVRELENKRSSLVAELSKKSTCQDDSCRNFSQENGMSCQQDQTNENLNKSAKKKKLKRLASNKSPVKKTRINEKSNKESQESLLPLQLSPRQKIRMQNEASQKCVITSKSDKKLENIDNIGHTDHKTQDDKSPRQTVPILTISMKAQKLAKYNPGDYIQDSSDLLSNDSPSLSDDSSYFSDVCDQSTCIKTPKHHTSLRDSKVQLYDHSTRQRNNYNRPLDVVERLDIRNEPNAIDAAKEVERTESIESHATETHKLASQKRGDDAILREKVRSDYQTLMKSLDHLSSEERKLKASDVQRDPMNDVQLRKSRRKELQKEHKKKLCRKFEAMTEKSCCANHCPNLMERIITLKADKQSENHNKKAEGVWKEAHFVEPHVPVVKSPKSKDKRQEISRDELILDMLKKVEKQKMLLLKEFGASLPDDIYYASMTSLTEPDKSDEPQKKMHRETCLSPEVTLINMSNGENNNKDSKKVKKTSESTKCEMAVQTSTLQDAGIAEDKGIQVEIKATCDDATNALSTNEELSTKHYPIEPIITVITPEVENSSSSSNNSMITGVIIDIDNEEVKVTPKKKKRTLSKRTSMRAMQKSHSAPPSKTSSPVKRFSKSLPSSCRSSPRKINIHFKKNGLDVNVDPSDGKKPTIDSSTDSSAMYSSLNTQNSSVREPYEIPVTKSKKVIKVRDISDTSTSFASPPSLAPKRPITASSTTPILEILDFSTFSAIERAKRDISPVSTPETPSPRTMMIPSNIPHTEKIGKVLRYSEELDDTTTSFTNKDTYSPIYEKQKDMSLAQSLYPQYLPTLSKSCTCQNPQCKLLHIKLEDIQDFALKNCPEILKKYEDLQNTCTERIASLTDLIEKVRSEQRGMELSVISPQDEMNSMKIHPEMQSSMKNVQRLVENIEAIHNQLAKTLYESQNAIMKGEAINKDISKNTTENQSVHSQTKSKLDHSVSTTVEHISDKLTSSKPKSKPRILKEEKVNIKLSRFQMPHKSSATMTTVTPERNSWPPVKIPTQDDNTIEELSKEILEKSRSKSTGMPVFRKIADYENTDILLPTKPDSSKPIGSPSKNGGNNVPVQTTDITVESEKDVVFESESVGISKVLPSLACGHRTNGRNKPPVTLHSGFYKTEIESMGHELSTIIEFDTPDTGNKNHVTMKSSTAKSFVTDESQREKSTVKKSVEVQTTKSSVTVKPSIHVAPLPIQSSLGKKISQASSSSFTKKSTGEMFASKLQEDEQTSPSRRTQNEMHLEYRRTDNAIGLEDSVKEKVNKQLQCNTSDKETKEVLQERLEKDKASSTSSNSFCELSGISEITSTPSSSLLKYASSEEMETALKQLGLSWAITTLKKTREASALSSSSNSDVTPLNTARRIISPNKKHVDPKILNLLDFSDVSSISIKEASKSTEQAVLFKGRTSTPKLQNSNSNTDKSNSLPTNSSGISFQEPSDSLTVPNVSLIKKKQPIARQSKYP
ncbi:PREDICTED: uncharacterized protein LOC106793955 isoform X1 [Polistes canadensis]|uniref:uncharacterized protein LOC106793955 isoform X1 n=3 Tax=Polistes canadensis TaxID=91411 RepID=UPI00071901A1|nr:PREDICTED: uncharacterized protein LOC106793955 isoform X1 [Polistes canadensis]XP_014616748.1 PREDICTED: uncharacterized protein LOC106793955 isoform X1 [Polistes canadensis]